MRLGWSETAKRARLERIVRPLKPWLFAAEQPGLQIAFDHVNPQPGGGITGFSYAGAAGEAVQEQGKPLAAKNSLRALYLSACLLRPNA